MSAGHEVHPHVGVALPNEVGLLEVLALHHRGVQFLGFRLITNLKKTSRSQKYYLELFSCLHHLISQFSKRLVSHDGGIRSDQSSNCLDPNYSTYL